MDRGPMGAILALLMVSLLFGPIIDMSTSTLAQTDCPPPDFSVGITEHHQTILMQGNDPTTNITEPKGAIKMIQRSYWNIPWNSSEVYMSIPLEAGNILLDQVEDVPHGDTTVFLPGRYSAAKNPDDPPETGRVEGGDFDGFYYWRFGAGADRSTSTVLRFNSTEDLEDYDDNFTDPAEWNINEGRLSLAENVSEATYTSKMYLGGKGIVSIDLTSDGLVQENMSFEITVDNGTTWIPAANGEVIDTTGGGNEFRWRITMTQNVSDPAPPVLDFVNVDAHFIPPNTKLLLEATYTLWIHEEGLHFTLFFPFDLSSYNLIFVGYIDQDVSFIVSGMDVAKTPEGKYPGKDTYTHMQGANDCDITFFFEFQVKPGSDPDFPWLLYLIPLVLVALIGVLYYVTRSPDEEEEEEAGDASEETDDDEVDLDAMDEGELLEHKAGLMASIKRLEEEHAEGIVGDDELEIRRDMYKKEAIEVMRRLHDMEPQDD